MYISVLLLSQTLKIRNPHWNNTYSEQRLGKGNSWILDLVHASGDSGLSKEEISTVVGIRPNNLKARNLDMLVGRSFMLEVNGRYFTPEDIEERLERHLKDSGSNEAARLQRERHERDRKARVFHGAAMKVEKLTDMVLATL